MKRKTNEPQPLEVRIAKLERELAITTKMATKSIKENRQMMIEIQRLVTRINNNENVIGQFRSKR